MTMHEHRIELKNLCELASNYCHLDDLIGNKALKDYYSEGDETLLFRTFEEWEKMGYKVNKGAKAFKFWGTPQDFEIRDPQDNTKVVSVGSFCPVVFKFSEYQVIEKNLL